jgi:hypothetical protein
MLPDSQDVPPLLAQGAIYQPIAAFVGVEFLLPEHGVIDWQIGVPGAAVPEAAVDEDRQLEFGEDEAGFAEEEIMPPPPFQLTFLSRRRIDG